MVPALSKPPLHDPHHNIDSYCKSYIYECQRIFKNELEETMKHPFRTINDIERIRQRGDFYFGINGIVTFKNSKLRETLPSIGINRILLETDSPYLAPVPHRGKCNESAFIIHTAAHIAQLLSIPLNEVASTTSANAKLLFKI